MNSRGEAVVLVASAEFILKSLPVRRSLEQRLVDDLKTALREEGVDGIRIEKHAARIVVHGIRDAQMSAQCCAKVFGVAYAAPATLLPAKMDDVIDTIIHLAERALLRGQSFAIRAHRSTSSPLSREQIETEGGSEVLLRLKDRNIRVDLKRPDVTLFVDLVDDRAYVYSERFEGPGGLPLSSQWRMLAVLDSGPLSLLAAYAMMRRGCVVEFLIPVSNQASFYSRERQLDLARKLRGAFARRSYRAFTLNFDQFLAQVTNKHLVDYAASKSLVRQVALGFAKQKKFRGLVFSDVAGEIRALEPLSNASTQPLPVFQPLIGLRYEDLVEMARQAGIADEQFYFANASDFGAARHIDVVGFSEDLVAKTVQETRL